MADYRQFLKQYGQIGENPRTKGYFGIFATMVLLIVLLLLIFPALRHIAKINREITDAREVVAKLETKLKNLDQARINLEEVREDLPLLDEALPVGSDMPKHLVSLDALAAKHGLSISSVEFTDVPLSKPKVQESELGTKDFIYSITLEGTFPRFRNFLNDLEHLIRISSVNTIKISKEENNPIKHTIGVRSYFLGATTTSPKDLGASPAKTDQSFPTGGQAPNNIKPGELPNE